MLRRLTSGHGRKTVLEQNKSCVSKGSGGGEGEGRGGGQKLKGGERDTVPMTERSVGPGRMTTSDVGTSIISLADF
jgi:hypothetical protein